MVSVSNHRPSRPPRTPGARNDVFHPRMLTFIFTHLFQFRLGVTVEAPAFVSIFQQFAIFPRRHASLPALAFSVSGGSRNLSLLWVVVRFFFYPATDTWIYSVSQI